MKKEYISPEIEVSAFSSEDVITLSGGVDNENGFGPLEPQD